MNGSALTRDTLIELARVCTAKYGKFLMTGPPSKLDVSDEDYRTFCAEVDVFADLVLRRTKRLAQHRTHTRDEAAMKRAKVSLLPAEMELAMATIEDDDNR